MIDQLPNELIDLLGQGLETNCDFVALYHTSRTIQRALQSQRVRRRTCSMCRKDVGYLIMLRCHCCQQYICSACVGWCVKDKGVYRIDHHSCLQK